MGIFMKKDYSDKHTFVICAYKESAFLEECIESLERWTAHQRPRTCRQSQAPS